MSAIAESARVAIQVADYAAVDATNKINALGLGWQVAGIDLTTGNTAPQTLILLVDVSPIHRGESYALEVALYDDAGELVMVPGPTGEQQPLRVGQTMTVDVPAVAGRVLPPQAVWSHAQMVVNFPGGLPVAAGRTYTWQARIDGDDQHRWETSFYVARPNPGPVIG